MYVCMHVYVGPVRASKFTANAYCERNNSPN